MVLSGKHHIVSKPLEMVLIVLHTDSSQTLLVSRGDVVGFWSWYDEMAYRVNYFQNQSDEEENIAGTSPKEREIKSGFQ